jgi:hypothetical protein
MLKRVAIWLVNNSIAMLFPVVENEIGGVPPISLILGLVYIFGGLRPMIKNTTAKIRPTTNKNQAISDAIAAIPVRPNMPAMRATTRNIKAQ